MSCSSIQSPNPLLRSLGAYAWKSMPFITDSNTERGVRVRIRVERSQNRTMLRHVLICPFLSGIHRCRFDPGLPELIEKGYSFGDIFPLHCRNSGALF
ncbi:hypothetical protein CDAR_93701 [Caerostris darwini]|uniref:Uncharacterized protein n=1 Tax=Caerostris darwini TaxID=1538125 RepID=A0AAV4NMN8_9ARAC|nr:hypothetical protein CDAR_93701 [Caerostris darwini]